MEDTKFDIRLHPEILYRDKYELEKLTFEELIDAHNDVIDFFQKLKIDLHNQLDLINKVRVEKLGLEDEVQVIKIPRNRG